MSDDEAFEMWKQLAEGDEDRQIVPLIDIAQEFNTTPRDIVRVALALKRESSGAVGRPAFWFKGTPWFSVPTVALIGSRLQLERAAVQHAATTPRTN